MQSRKECEATAPGRRRRTLRGWHVHDNGIKTHYIRRLHKTSYVDDLHRSSRNAIL
jgi:hypothetical protein